MKKLLIWTAADVDLIKKTFGVSLKAMKPNIPEHQFISYAEGQEAPIPNVDEVILICGNKPLDTLRRQGLAPKNRTVNSMRETAIKIGPGWGLVTFDPGIVNSEPEQGQVMDWDMRLAVRLLNTGTLKPNLTMKKYRYVSDYSDLIKRVEYTYSLTKKAVPVSMDTETMTFHPWYPDRDIVSISFTKDMNTAEVLYTGPGFSPVEINTDADLFSQIEWLLTTDKIKLEMANGKYDLVWIREKWGIYCKNFKFDLMLVASLLDENRSNSLNMLAKIRTNMGGYDDEFNNTVDKGHMELLPANDKYLNYAGGDTDACREASEALRDELLEDEQLTKFYVTILHPAARAFEKIEHRGMCVDQEKFAVLRQDLDKTIEESKAKAIDILPMKMRHKYRDRMAEQEADGKNPLLPSILKDYFFTPMGLNLKPKVKTEKTQEPSMAKSHLKMFSDVPEAMAMVEALTSMDVASKTRSTFVDGFLRHLRPDGRIHPTYMLFHGGFNDDEDDESGSTTGRLSAKDPPVQIIPKKTYWGKRIRECYPAPKGKVILSVDFNQGELRVVACIANEKNMIKAYENNMDLHAVTGSSLVGVSYEEFIKWPDSGDVKLIALYKEYRDRAKPGNFGLLYAMQVDGFIVYAWSNYGIKLTYAEAEKIRDTFFQLYPGLLTYHDKQRKLVKLTGQVRSPLGRVRHLSTIHAWDRKVKSKAERQAINAPTQATLTDMLVWSMSLIEDAYPNDEIATVATIHDNGIAYVDEDKVELRAAQVKEIMENLPFHELGWKPQLKFIADAEAGMDLAHLKKVKVVA